MKLRYRYVTRKIGEEYISVPVGKEAEENHGMMRLNQTGADIVAMLGKDVTMDEITQKMAKKYRIEQQEMLAYVQEFVRRLTEQGLVE